MSTAGDSPLSHEEHLDVLACVERLYQCRSLAAFPDHVLAAVAPLVPSTLSAFNEVNLARNRVVWVMDRAVESMAVIQENWERHSAEHPLVRYVTETGDGQAIKISDLLSEAAYHQLAIYQTVYRGLGAEDQMSLTIRSDEGIIIALAFNRRQRDFTESERVKLNLIRPHLLQAYANLEELAGHADETADLRTALRETGHGLIALDATDGIAHASPGACECLARYFPGAEPRAAVPADILEWLTTDPTTPFTRAAGDGRLVVRRPRGAERRLILVSEETRRCLPTGARLTDREMDVLHWLAAGKSNAEIATILGLAHGTVKRHVEKLIAKLGVQNRTGAAARARDLLP